MKHSKFLAIFIFLAFFLTLNFQVYAQVSCSGTCVTAAQVAQETSNYQQGTSGAKCLFIYNSQIYQPPSGTISGGTHMDLHVCGDDVTGIMKQSHLSDPSHYLTPYVCAPLCSGATTVATTTQTSTITGQGSTTVSQTTILNTGSQGCQPYCPSLCGQSNTCGGYCPNTEFFSPGKCGNPACIPSCSGQSCAQSDGCNGTCPSTDKNTCGLCGNAPCCIAKELCDDQLDNNCNGVIDESCGTIEHLLNNFPETINSTSRAARANLEESGKLISKPNLQTRIFGIAAFFFAGLTLLVGIFRFELIKRFSRKEIIKYHSLLGFFSIFFVVLHVLTVLLDVTGWAKTINLKNALLPHFSGYVLFNVALGTIGLYLLLTTILSGIFFVRISRLISYKWWMLLHRGSFVFYMFIFFHSLRLGTDFKNPYIIVFFLHVFVIILLYIAYRVRKIKLKNINEEFKKMIENLKTSSKILLSEISKDPNLIDKKITTTGDLTKLPMQASVKEEWWQIYDEYASFFALVPEGTQPDHYSVIEGIVRKSGEQIYIEVQKLKK